MTKPGNIDQFNVANLTDEAQIGVYEDPSLGITTKKKTTAINLRDYITFGVGQYGAVGDGVTDDTASFQLAGDASRVVSVPGGTYCISNITWTTDVHLILADNAVLKHIDNASDHMFEVNATLKITGGTIDGNKDNQEGRYDTIHSNSTGVRVVCDNVRFTNTVHASIDFQQGLSGGLVVKNCEFTGMAQHTTLLEGLTFCIVGAGVTPEVDISHCRFIGDTPQQTTIQVGGIYLSGTSTSARITENYFEKIGMNELTQGNFVGNVYLYTDADETVIANNVFVDSYYQPIGMQNARNVVCTGNVIKGSNSPAGEGLISYQNVRSYAESLVNCIITNNVIDVQGDRLHRCIDIQGQSSGSYDTDSLIISNNTVLGGDLAVDLRWVKAVDISNNFFSGQNRYGIRCLDLNDAGTKINVSGGVMKEFGTLGFYMPESNNTDNASVSITGVLFDGTDRPNGDVGDPAYFVQIRGESGAMCERVIIANCIGIGQMSTEDWNVEWTDEVIIQGNCSDGDTSHYTGANNTSEYITGNNWQTLQTYTPTNVVTTRTYDADATTTDELADVLGSLVADLQSQGVIN